MHQDKTKEVSPRCMVLPQQPSCQGSRDELGRGEMPSQWKADGDEHVPLRVLSGEEVTETRDNHNDIKK